MKAVPAAVPLALGATLAAALAGAGYLWSEYQALAEESRATIATQGTRIAELETELAEATSENEELADAFQNEKNRNEGFSKQINAISGKIEVLDKLSKTDPELLAKYSKVFFLNENYSPPRLATIPKQFYYDESRTFDFHADAIDHLTDMIEEAKEDGVDLFISSAYRSFTTQGSLKAGYTVRYGSGANAFSADQGYSEHQLGTTIDFTTTGIGGGLVEAFDATPAFKWLEDNAHKYGFALSYPKGNAYYVYEPWHWRFVGTELAKDLHKDGKHFYDLDQREIDPYLANIFD